MSWAKIHHKSRVYMKNMSSTTTPNQLLFTIIILMSVMFIMPISMIRNLLNKIIMISHLQIYQQVPLQCSIALFRQDSPHEKQGLNQQASSNVSKRYFISLILNKKHIRLLIFSGTNCPIQDVMIHPYLSNFIRWENVWF